MILDQERLKQFVAAWQVCTLAEVARMFGISRRDASALAAKLRKGGVPMRDHRCKPSIDFNALAEVAREAGQ